MSTTTSVHYYPDAEEQATDTQGQWNRIQAICIQGLGHDFEVAPEFGFDVLASQPPTMLEVLLQKYRKDIRTREASKESLRRYSPFTNFTFVAFTCRPVLAHSRSQPTTGVLYISLGALFLLFFLHLYHTAQNCPSYWYLTIIMILSMFASLFSPATTTIAMEYAPSPLSSTPLSSAGHVLSTTTLSFDPMESMGELPRKGPKTEAKNKELLAALKFVKKQQLRAWYDTLVVTPAHEAMTSLLAKETSMKSLFFRRKNNSFSFDFVVLTSNSEPTTSSSFAKSPSHDSAMYIFKANSKQVFTGEFNTLQQPSLTPPPAPVSAPSSDLQDASMEDARLPVAESIVERVRADPSILGNNMLGPKKDSIASITWGLNSALKDVEKAVRTGRKSCTMHSTGQKPTGISKKSKTRSARHPRASQPTTSQVHLQVLVRNRNRMPFDEEEDSDEDNTSEISTPLAATPK
ncbi:hypothetical protein KCU65_g6782, partial [Aureobasidium melanogenum]